MYLIHKRQHFPIANVFNLCFIACSKSTTCSFVYIHIYIYVCISIQIQGNIWEKTFWFPFAIRLINAVRSSFYLARDLMRFFSIFISYSCEFFPLLCLPRPLWFDLWYLWSPFVCGRGSSTCEFAKLLVTDNQSDYFFRFVRLRFPHSQNPQWILRSQNL